LWAKTIFLFDACKYKNKIFNEKAGNLKEDGIYNCLVASEWNFHSFSVDPQLSDNFRKTKY